jgi:hypothetical protein
MSLPYASERAWRQVKDLSAWRFRGKNYIGAAERPFQEMLLSAFINRLPSHGRQTALGRCSDKNLAWRDGQNSFRQLGGGVIGRTLVSTMNASWGLRGDNAQSHKHDGNTVFRRYPSVSVSVRSRRGVTFTNHGTCSKFAKRLVPL